MMGTFLKSFDTVQQVIGIVLADGHFFALAAETDQKYLHFATVLVVLADDFDFDRAAADAADFKFAERAVARRLARLIIFPSHEKSGGIHAHSLPCRMDNGCPMQAGCG